MRALLRAEAAATPAGDWVRGWGLDPNVFGSAAAHRELIDDVVSGRPCLIRLFDGHSALASTRALELAGVTGPRKFDQAVGSGLRRQRQAHRAPAGGRCH